MKTILIISPHGDDELLGMGGYIINEITKLYDHSDLNRFFYNPTAEMLVLDMAWRVEALIEDNNLEVKLTKIELAETDNNRVIWESQ